MYKRLISVDEETEEILKQQPAKKASDFMRKAAKHYARTLTTPEPKKETPKPEEKKIPTVKIKI